jgi:hypothetical protein
MTAGVALGACAGDFQSVAAPEEPLPQRAEPATSAHEAMPPDDQLKPPGSSWFCFREQGRGHNSVCRRAREECEASRSGDAAKWDKEGAGRLSECAERVEAQCATYVDRRNEARHFDCYERLSDCSEAVTMRRRNLELYGDVSDCGSW